MQPSILHRVAAFVLVTVAAYLPCVRVAEAQGYREIVGGPLTTKRFERLARVYLQPTDAEMSALDRLHERYLERFRSEIDPEIKRIAESGNDGFPTKEQWERLLRDIDRVADRIAEADNALFAAAGDAVVEAKRAGVGRMRAARERQRLLGGMARFAPMAFGGGTQFVDVADLLARPAHFEALEPEARARLDALLATQEARLNAQARSYSTEARQAMSGYLEISLQMMADAQGEFAGAGAAAGDGAATTTGAAAADDAAPGAAAGAAGGDVAAQQAAAEALAQAAAEAAVEAEMAKGRDRMARMQRSMAELAKPLRKVIRANHADNRGASGQFEAILGRAVATELRETVALRSLGTAAYGYAGDEELQSVARRVRRAVSADAALVARVDEALLARRAARAEAFESHLATIDRLDAGGFQLGGYGEEPDIETPEGRAQLEYASAMSGMYTRTAKIEEELRNALVAILGARVDEFFTREQVAEGENGATTEVFVPKPEEAIAGAGDGDGDGADAGGGEAGWSVFSIGELAPLSRPRVSEALALAGVEADESVVDALHEAWVAGRWTERVVPLVGAHAEAYGNCYTFSEAGEIGYDRAQIEKAGALAQSAYAAANEAESALVADLAGALGLAPDAPAALLLRLDELDRVAAPDAGVYGGEAPRMFNLMRALALAQATPDEVRAVVAASAEEWRSAVDAARSLVARGLALENQTLVAQARMQAGEDAQAFDALRIATNERGKDVAALRARLAKAFESACGAAIADPERREAFARARLRAVHPGLHRPSDSAERQLTAALALDGIDEDLRARVEALRAEYLALFDQMTGALVKASEDAVIGEDADWTAYRAKMEEIERLRFDRRERTVRALGELRRMLGAERVARVPGLAEPVDAPRAPANPWDMSGGDDE
jgi:hypothetical protein